MELQQQDAQRALQERQAAEERLREQADEPGMAEEGAGGRNMDEELKLQEEIRQAMEWEKQEDLRRERGERAKRRRKVPARYSSAFTVLW